MRTMRVLGFVAVLALLAVGCGTAGGTSLTGGSSNDDVVRPISIVEPREGQSVSGPTRVSGEASVYEANVILRVLDPSGKQYLSTFTTATAAAPERGTWSTEIEFPTAPAGTWTIEASEESAEDGTTTFVTKRQVRIG